MWDLIGWTLKFASHYCTKCCRWWIHEEICCAQCCRSRTRFYCCNIARNKFWGGYTMQFSHCAQYCAQYCTVYPDLKARIHGATLCARLRATSVTRRGYTVATFRAPLRAIFDQTILKKTEILHVMLRVMLHEMLRPYSHVERRMLRAILCAMLHRVSGP